MYGGDHLNSLWSAGCNLPAFMGRPIKYVVWWSLTINLPMYKWKHQIHNFKMKTMWSRDAVEEQKVFLRHYIRINLKLESDFSENPRKIKYTNNQLKWHASNQVIQMKTSCTETWDASEAPAAVLWNSELSDLDLLVTSNN